MSKSDTPASKRKATSRRSSADRSENAAHAKRLDQYYTKDMVVKKCWKEVLHYIATNPANWRFVEPSAGEGAFLRIMPADTIAIDKDPKHPNIQKADFLEIALPTDRPLATVGNPPFGKRSQLALDFINHGAKYAKVIGMILPGTFCKPGLQNRINPALHLVFQMTLERNAFTFLGKDFDVPAVFQIWELRAEPRAKIKVKMRHPDFEFTTADRADFAITRIGAYAGTIYHDFTKSKSSDHFVRVINKALDIERIMTRLALKEAAGNTAAIPSLAKGEIVQLYEGHMAGLSGKGPPLPSWKSATPTSDSDAAEPGHARRSPRVGRREVKLSSSRKAGRLRLRYRHPRRRLPLFR